MVKLQEKTELMDEVTVERAISRMAYEILEHGRDTDDTVIIGIQTRGAVLARKIAAQMERFGGKRIPIGSLDITFYRDDLTILSEHPVVNGTDIPFSVHQKRIILVDDVLYTGRTIRAAIEEIFDLGRPDRIELAILVDRGHRELPFSADYVGKTAPTSKSEHINVEIDGNGVIKRVAICERGEG